jgi:hypothetical protein
MKLQKGPLVLLCAAALLGGFVYLYEIQGSAQRQQTQLESKQLFAFKEAEIESCVLKTPKQTLTFKRSSITTPTPKPPKSSPSPWSLTLQPANGKLQPPVPASDSSVTYLLNLLATGQRQPLATDAPETTLNIPPARSPEFGFDKPLATIEVILKNQARHRLILGKLNFDRSALYAQVDPPQTGTGDLNVVLVSIDFENAISRPLTEWQDTLTKPLKKP